MIRLAALDLAYSHGHLRYWPIRWQPAPVDQAIRVDVKRVQRTGPS